MDNIGHFVQGRHTATSLSLTYKISNAIKSIIYQGNHKRPEVYISVFDYICIDVYVYIHIISNTYRYINIDTNRCKSNISYNL